ncbi:hypothetical protein J4Q44_G00273550 [Coregonus suidteri]|uniref:Uncharacterized protein n=1 Tax=Coregonus suidteri TaxID=861788 RepID=A0AAN8L6W7_9TELE
MGANNAVREAIHVREIFTSYFFEEGAVPWQHHRLPYAQPNALLRAIHMAIRVFFYLLSYVNCSYYIPSFSPFDFYFSGEGAVQYKVLCSHLVWTPGYISCVGEPLAHLNWLTQRAQHDQRYILK